jgi:transposase-like protein
MNALQHTSPAVQALRDAWMARLKRKAIDLVVQGSSVTKVASELSLPASTVISWLRTAGVSLKGRPRPDVKVSHALRSTAIEQVMAGRNAAVVAEELRVTTARIYQWVRAAGLTKPRHISKSNATRYSAEFKREAVRQVVDLERSVQTVAVEADISHHSLRSWIKAAAA